ncbi:hypothetical protein AAMO2058_001488000 [Amorphochlora amoebiformis]
MSTFSSITFGESTGESLGAWGKGCTKGNDSTFANPFSGGSQTDLWSNKSSGFGVSGESGFGTTRGTNEGGWGMTGADKLDGRKSSGSLFGSFSKSSFSGSDGTEENSFIGRANQKTWGFGGNSLFGSGEKKSSSSSVSTSGSLWGSFGSPEKATVNPFRGSSNVSNHISSCDREDGTSSTGSGTQSQWTSTPQFTPGANDGNSWIQGSQPASGNQTMDSSHGNRLSSGLTQAQGSKDSDMKELASLDNPNPYFIDPALPSSTESAVSEPKKQKKQYYLSKPLPRVHRLKPYARRYYHQTYNTGRSGLRKRLVFDTPSLQDLTLVSRRNDVLNISPNGFSLPEDVDILLSSGSSDWDAKTWTSTKSSSTGPTSPKRSEKTPSDEVEYTHCVDGRRVTLNEDEHDFPSIINDLTIVHPAYGKVEWNGPRYVPSLELIKNSASFQRKKISLFPNAELQPPPGQGLNQDIRVTVSGVGKWSRKKEKKLRACCNKNETNFVAFTKAGDWSFDVLCVG